MVAIVALSVGDLYMTTALLTSGGMIESNPIARLVMSHHSPAVLAVWKMCTVGLAVAILLYARRRWSAECAAWLGVAALTMLTLHWVRYIDETVDYALIVASARACPELYALVAEDWISID